MSQIIIPSEFRVPRSHPLREFLESRDGRKFQMQVAMSDALSAAAERTAKRHKMRGPDVLDGLVTALVSCAQALAPHEEWGGVSVILADEIRRRMTVTGENAR